MKAYSECKQLLEDAEMSAGNDVDNGLDEGRSIAADRGFDAKDCFIVLYSQQQFQGARKIFDQTTDIQQPKERSLKTVGPCGWRIIR